MFSRFTRYFDEVARRGSIRRASERLNIAPSAIDRQILQMEEQLGVKLFERLPQGLRLTAAGELLVDAVRRWRRDFARVRAQIDDLQGLRRGEVSIALAEGATEFLAGALRRFQQDYPAISFRLRVLSAQAAADAVLRGEVELGLTFNPPTGHLLRVEKTRVTQLGAAVLPGHPLAARSEIALLDLADYPLILPDDSISLRDIFDAAWTKGAGATAFLATEANSIAAIKALVRNGMGVGMLTPLDAMAELQAGTLRFLPLKGSGIPLSVLALVTAAGRTLSAPAALAQQHLAAAMDEAA